MLQNGKKWLASVLALTIALGDCGGMTVLATEDTVATKSAVSENNMAAENIISEDTPPLSDIDTTSETPETDQVPELPALHIGQIPEGEKLPGADDDDFAYDLPVSFETTDSLILFPNYAIEVPEAEETGTLEWSILRGEKGLEPGSVTLLDEEDDWKSFEEVSSSPFFTMEEIEDTESAYDRMMALTPGAFTADKDADSYDYYIRVAYYPENETGQHTTFYTAVTVPFLPFFDTLSGGEDTPENTTGTEEIPVTNVSGEASISENNTEDTVSSVSENNAPAPDSTVSENNADLTVDDMSKEQAKYTENDALSADENGTEDTAADVDSENTGADQTAEVLSTLSENNSMADVSTLSDEETTTRETEKAEVTAITLSETQELTMQPTEPDNTKLITATVTAEPSGSVVPPLLWESSDKDVATVTAGENGTAVITAIAEGYAKITASCGGKTASVIVDVVPDKNNPARDKLLDLSGDIQVIGFERESDALVYNGQKIKQSLRVYHKSTHKNTLLNEETDYTLLKEKIDYTLSYKNNVNAAAWNTVKAPSVTINLKGQYQGSVTLYFTIKPLDINNIDIYNPDITVPGEDGDAVKKTPGYEQAVNYSKKLSIPAPVLTFGKKKLAVKKDFTCDYTTPGKGMAALPADYTNGALYDDGKVYSYTVNGTGNFTGSFPMQLVVLKDKARNFSSASVKLDKKQYEYHGTPLTKSDVRITEVKIGGTTLNAADFTYEVFATGTEGAYVMVSPSTSGKEAGYRGCKKITLKLVGDRLLKDAVAGTDWKETIPFSQKTVDKNGGIFQTGPALLTFGEGSEKKSLTEGTDYTVKYGNAKKAGRVTATFTGKGRYKGTLKLTYTITPNTDITIYYGKNVKKNNGTYEVAYQKGGAVPELILKDQEYTVLKNKTDYTIKYKDNKVPGTPMTCEIKGKGSYAGYEKTVTLTVAKANISQCTISVPDKPYSDKPNKWKSTVTIKDVNGKKLTAGKDYDKDFTYSHTQEQSPRPNTEITVTVKGLDCYEGSSITGTYRIFEKNISTLKIVIDPQEYTGEEIKLEKKDIHVYANSTDAKNKQNEITKGCYEIVESEYKNNIKAGTAKVTLHGIGEYGGTKTYSFKILKKKYLINRVKGITLDKTTHQVSLTAKREERMLTATITPETPDQILTNPTIIWTSSNSNIATVEPVTASAEGSSQNPLVSSVIIQGKKAGKVTITATAQDGNKKAKCVVTISIPVLKQANQTIEGKVGDTYQLTFVGYENQAPDTEGIAFESANPNIVSVTDKGLLTMHKMGASTIKVYAGSRENVQQCYVIVEETITDPEHDSRALVYRQKEGCSDDTPYINQMLRDWEWGDRSKYEYMYLPAGVYHIDPTSGGYDVLGKYKFGGIVLTKNQTLIMSPETKLVAIGNNKSNYQIISVFGGSNVTISGGQIIGERDSHSGTSGEWGHGISIFGGTNVFIKDVEISKCWGDGIYLGFYDGPNKYSNGVTIKNCNIHDNRRNNLSITDVSNVTVRNCQFNNAHGIAPQYGIDIEPNKNRTCSNVTISGCQFQGNAGGTIQILGQLNAHVKSVTIENCTGDKEPVKWAGYGGSVSGVVQKGNKWN